LQFFTHARQGVILAALTAAGVSLLTSAPALAHARVRHGIGWLPSLTTLTNDATDVLPDGSTTVNAAVRPGFLVQPTGSVTFTDTTNGTALGSVPLGSSCYLHTGPCTTSISVPAASLAAGTNVITGTYSGDQWQRPSAGTTILFLETQTTTDGVTTTTCGYTCDTGTQSSSDGTTSVDITAPADSDATITDSFTTDELPCSTSGGGDTVIFSATGLTANKIVFMQAIGDAADTLESIYFGGEHVCFESPRVFTTEPGTPPATLDPTTGLYDGLLPQCVEPGGGGEARRDYWGHALNPPCVDFSEFDIVGGDSPDVYNQQFETTASDPRASN
jgi:hypothetical protein